jgi:hypothetical protein
VNDVPLTRISVNNFIRDLILLYGSLILLITAYINGRLILLELFSWRLGENFFFHHHRIP